MKNVAMALLALGAMVAASVATQDWDPSDNSKIIAAVRAAATESVNDDMHRVTTEPFGMSDEIAALCRQVPDAVKHNPHIDYYCHIYTNELALTPMKTGKGKYKPGSIIIKQKYSDKRATKTELFTIMRKMPNGYDDDNGNWEYSIVDAKGTTVLSRGRTDSCINCHMDYAESDYVTRLYMSSTTE